MTLENAIEQATKALLNADALLISAGAGMGVDSGLPDFRGDKGFWKAYPPIAKLGLSFTEIATPKWFHQNPKLAWAFYGHLLTLFQQTIPHDGFLQLLEIAKDKKGGYFVFTSNVDGQFQKAGYDEDKIVECHGSIHYLQCTKPCRDEIWDANGVNVKIDEHAFEALEPFPQCKNCGMIARPNVLMFEDWVWNDGRTEKQEKRLNDWLNKLPDGDFNLAIIEIGAGTAVPTVRIYSELVANKENRTLIRINPRDYEVPNGHISIPLSGAEGIDRILKLVNFTD
ncbi:MAG: NAD-dependent deacetylase [Candidatus Parabeggiatoa sp. nov. 1]|nr:MAG: NAD-dependent deacetylase [Gammaproteobacteria bacterium]